MSDRIDGWKAIGAYFGRDRTTAIRWANARGLPVQRMPGGKRATVYAHKADLDAWLAGGGPGHAENDPAARAVAFEAGSDDIQAPATARRWPIGGAWMVAGLLSMPVLAIVVAAPAWLPWTPAPTAQAAIAMPADPAMASAFVAAREDWAKRTPESLIRAIRTFETITRHEPGFAPAYANLADAYLLAREFGSFDETQAFERARRAADRALRIDPASDDAHRALGFIRYWWDRDPKAAGIAFRRARALSPNEAQTRFWYGNILSDNGEHEAGLRELNVARLMEPGSVAIQTDFAWALWASGNRVEAMAMLEALARAHPDFPIVHDCLSIIRLADGDYAGYADAFERFARLRDDAAGVAHAQAIRRALAGDPRRAHAVLRDFSTADIARNARRNHSWVAFLAAVARDRVALHAILDTAERNHETWGDAGLVRRIAQYASDDSEITGLLARRKGPAIE